jgi:hypothetical protein
MERDPDVADPTAVVAHEARGIMSSAQLAVSALQTSPLAKAEPWCDLLDSAVRDLAHLAAELDAFAPLAAAGRSSDPLPVVNLEHELREIASGFRRLNRDVVIDAQPVPAVRCDPAALEALLELVAVAAPLHISVSTDQMGRVEVRVVRADGTAMKAGRRAASALMRVLGVTQVEEPSGLAFFFASEQ